MIFVISIILELLGTFLIVYGFAHEKEVIEWEQRQLRTFRFRWKRRKAIHRIRVKRFKTLIVKPVWEDFTRWVFKETY